MIKYGGHKFKNKQNLARYRREMKIWDKLWAKVEKETAAGHKPSEAEIERRMNWVLGLRCGMCNGTGNSSYRGRARMTRNRGLGHHETHI